MKYRGVLQTALRRRSDRRLVRVVAAVAIALSLAHTARLVVGDQTGWQADWRHFAAVVSLEDPYAVDAYRWSPVAKWVLVPVVAAGWGVFAAGHVAVLAFLRDWRIIAIVLVSFPFWEDVIWGNTVTFAFIAAWLAVTGNRWATWTFYALAVLVPRPLMLPVLAWLLWKQPDTRTGFATLFAVHAALVLMTGFAGEWAARLIASPAEQMPWLSNWAPSRWIGSLWVPIGAALAVWLTRVGRLGLASLAIQPYLFAYYLLFGLLELRPRDAAPQGATLDPVRM